MPRCWEIRDCAADVEEYKDGMGEGGDLIDTCAHPNVFDDRCPSKCVFANCQRPTREITTDPALLFDPTVDRDAAIKEECLHCEFFLTKAPRLGDSA